MYKLIPKNGHVIIEQIKAKDVKNYTGKKMAEVETRGMDVLQYGKVIYGNEEYKVGDIVLYPQLASDKTNFGDPRQHIVEAIHIKAKLEQTK